MTEIDEVRRNVAELQVQLQTAYKRIVTLNKMVNTLKSTYNTPDKAEYAKHPYALGSEESRKIESTLMIQPQSESEKLQADLEPIYDPQEYSRYLINMNKDK